MPTVALMQPETDYTKIGSLPFRAGGNVLSYSGVTSDGYAYGAAIPDKNTVRALPTYAVFTNLQTRSITFLTDRKSRPKPAQVGAMDATKRWVVWIETDPTDATPNSWKLYAYDRQTQTARMIATAPLSSETNEPRIESDPDPYIFGDTVYVSAVSNVSNKGNPTNAIYSVPANGTQPMKTLLPRATGAGIEHAHLIYLVGTRQYSRNLTNGTTKKLAKLRPTNMPAGWDYAGGTIARGIPQTQSAGSPLGQLAITTSDGKTITLPHMQQSVGDLHATSRWVGFQVQPSDGNTYVYIYDLHHKRLALLKDGINFLPPSGTGRTMLVGVARAGAKQITSYDILELK